MELELLRNIIKKDNQLIEQLEKNIKLLEEQVAILKGTD